MMKKYYVNWLVEGILSNWGKVFGRCFMALRGPVALRHMRFWLTDLDGNVVRLRSRRCRSCYIFTTYN